MANNPLVKKIDELINLYNNRYVDLIEDLADADTVKHLQAAMALLLDVSLSLKNHETNLVDNQKFVQLSEQITLLEETIVKLAKIISDNATKHIPSNQVPLIDLDLFDQQLNNIHTTTSSMTGIENDGSVESDDGMDIDNDRQTKINFNPEPEVQPYHVDEAPTHITKSNTPVPPKSILKNPQQSTTPTLLHQYQNNELKQQGVIRGIERKMISLTEGLTRSSRQPTDSRRKQVEAYTKQLEGLYSKASTPYIKEHFESLPQKSPLRSLLRTEYTKRVNQQEISSTQHQIKPQ